MFKADLGSIQANCGYNKKATVVILHGGQTIERELSPNLAEEIREFSDSVKARLSKVGKK